MIEHFLLVFFILLSSVSIFYTLKFSKIIFEMQDKIEESIITISSAHISVKNALKKNVVYDDPIARNVIMEIKLSRDSLMTVADMLSKYTNEEFEYDEEEDENV